MRTDTLSRMRRTSVLVLMLTLAAPGCATAPARAALGAPASAKDRFVRVRIAEEGNVVRRIALETYVQGTIISEFAPPEGEEQIVERMLEVQSVIARTYALANAGRHQRQGFDLCSTTHCQLYQPSRLKRSRWAAAGRLAASRTEGEVLLYERVPVATLFHADCGGHTSTSVDAWGGTARPYLTAVPDDDVDPATHAAWRHEVSTAALVRALNTDSRTRVGTRLGKITVEERDRSGRAETIALDGQRQRRVRGEVFRAVVAQQLGERTIRSTMFEVRRDGGVFVFNGRGFGHGVGLCQAGALARIKAGATRGAILRRYFPGTTLASL